MSRPSPTESATLYKPGTKKIGNNGKLWIVTITTNGTHRWSKIPYYETHWNGGRPYTVYLIDPTTVSIYDTYTHKLIKTYKNIEKITIGKYTYYSTRGRGHNLDGNSVLLKLKAKYVFIGDSIYEFTTPEPITHYYSLVGNSNVPYPVAISDNYAYYMISNTYVDKKKMTDLFGKIDWEDSYGKYYELTNNKQKLAKENNIKIHKMKNYKSIHEMKR